MWLIGLSSCVDRPDTEVIHTPLSMLTLLHGDCSYQDSYQIKSFHFLSWFWIQRTDQWKSYSTLTVLVKWPEGLMYTVTEWLTLHSVTSTIQIRPSFCHINKFYTTTICLTSIPPCCVAPAAWPPRRGRGAWDTPQTSGTVAVPRCMCIAMPLGVAPSWPSSSSPRSCPSVQMRRGTNLYMHAFECIWMAHHSK